MDSPKLAIGVNDAISYNPVVNTTPSSVLVRLLRLSGSVYAPTEEIPGSELNEVSFNKSISVLKNMLHILGIIGHNARGKRGHGNLKGAQTDFALTFGEPIEELVPWL